MNSKCLPDSGLVCGLPADRALSELSKSVVSAFAFTLSFNSRRLFRKLRGDFRGITAVQGPICNPKVLVGTALVVMRLKRSPELLDPDFSGGEKMRSKLAARCDSLSSTMMAIEMDVCWECRLLRGFSELLSNR